MQVPSWVPFQCAGRLAIRTRLLRGETLENHQPQAPFFGLVAQQLEQPPVERKVAGANPVETANFNMVM